MQIPIKKRVRGTPPMLMRRGEGGCVYPTPMESDGVEWSRRRRHKSWSDAQEIEGPECW
jgi:hypothetical protein